MRPQGNNSNWPADRLTLAGHLTNAERKWRTHLNLCFFCGQSGHSYTDCPRNRHNNSNTLANLSRSGQTPRNTSAAQTSSTNNRNQNSPQGQGNHANQAGGNQRNAFGRATFTINGAPEEVPSTTPAADAGNATPTQ